MRSRSSRWAIERIVTRGLPAGVVEQRVDVERIALEPHREIGRREQAIEIRREPEAIGGREERVELEHADALDRRRLHLPDERGEIERLLLLPGLGEQRRHQDVLAAATRLGVDARERQHARRGRRRTLGEELRVGDDRRAGRLERPQDRQRPRRAAARRVDREVRRLLAGGRCGRASVPIPPDPRASASPRARQTRPASAQASALRRD